MRKFAIFSLFVLVLSPLSALANQLTFEGDYDPSNWTLSGVNTSMSTGGDTSSAVFSYDASGQGYSPFTFAFSNSSDDALDLTFDWNWTGHHSWYQATGSLYFVTDGVETLLTSIGAGGFNVSGTETFSIAAGSDFGWKITGSHFDYSQLLYGNLTISNVQGQFAAVPAPAAPALLVGLMLLAFRQRFAA